MYSDICFLAKYLNFITNKFGWGIVVRNALLLLITIYMPYFIGKTNKNERII